MWEDILQYFPISSPCAFLPSERIINKSQVGLNLGNHRREGAPGNIDQTKFFSRPTPITIRMFV